MSDAFYTLVRTLGRPVFWLSARATVLHADRLRGHPAGLIVAPNHLSPYDVACLIAGTRRRLDFVSIVEIFRNRWAGRLLRGMNAFPLDRGRVDTGTTRTILDRLRRRRTIAMFPEGRIRTAATSLLGGGDFKPSVARIARLAGVPIVPCVILGSGAYGRAAAWLPLRRTRYAINFGEPIVVSRDGDESAACDDAVARMRGAYDALYAELRAASGLNVADSPGAGGDPRNPRGVRGPRRDVARAVSTRMWFCDGFHGTMGRRSPCRRGTARGSSPAHFAPVGGGTR